MRPRFARIQLALCLVAAGIGASFAPAADLVQSIRFHPEAAIEINPAASSMNASWPKHNYSDTIFKGGAYGYGFMRPSLWGDRREYWADDLTGQFFALLAPPPGGVKGYSVSIRLTSAGKTLAQVSQPATDHRISFLVRMADVPAGAYKATASLTAPDGKIASSAEFAFVKTEKKNPAVPIPAEGIPICLEAQTFVPDAAWGVRAGIPLPLNSVMDPGGFALFEDGRQVPAEVRARATWCPDGAVQWIHLDFIGRYRDGKPAEYRLKLLPAPAAASASPLKVVVRDEDIAVDTGAAQFTVNRKKFAGVSFAGAGPARDSAGPYLVDEKGQRFEPDATTEVSVEEQGPVRVVIVAKGWYANAASAEKRLCKFVTRITAFAGQPMVRFSHQTYITYDTRLKQLADMGFSLSAPGAKSFQLGADGKSLDGPLPPAPQTVFLHQDRWDHFRLVGAAAPAEGKVSDGWFSLLGDSSARTTVFLRDVWQKYPKEVEMSSAGATLHFWPKHGQKTFSQEEELLVKNVYKFLCFHHGALLDLQTPAYYWTRFDALSKTDGSFTWRESEQAATKSANAQGVVILNDFAVLVSDGKAQSGLAAASAPAAAKLFDFDPAAMAAPEWNAASGALGPMAAVDRKHFPDMEDAVEKGFLSWTRSVERNNDYGMFNYADTQTIWIVPENRPGLHRTWQSSHYHNVSTNWLLWYRSGSPDLLRWARKNTDHWMNVDMCNYVDEAHPIDLRQHELGAMQHVGWKQHWASSLKSEPWGQYRGVTGHFIDPDAALWCWYLSGDERAREAYSFWEGSYHKTMSGMLVGTAREPINTLAYAITNYQAGRDPALLPVIYTTAQQIRTLQPLEDQRPGPLWHPLWMNRYYQQTRDPQYVPFILKYADMWVNDESTWTLGLCAQAFALSNDRKFLDKHLPHVSAFPRVYFRRAGHPYDWFAYGPGPLGDCYAGLSWGCFLRALNQAGIETLPDARPETMTLANTTVRYLCGARSSDATPGTVVLALKTEDKSAQVKMAGFGLIADMHNWHSRVISPGGAVLHDVLLPAPNAAVGVRGEHEEKLALATEAEKGCYRIELSKAEGSIQAPATDLAFEAQVLDKKRAYSGAPVLAWLCPSDDKAPVTLTFTAVPVFVWGGSACSVRVEDANGKRLCDKSLWAFDAPSKTTTLTLDPKTAPLPWKLDIIGLTTVRWDGRAETMLLAMNKESFKPILSAIRQAPAKK